MSLLLAKSRFQINCFMKILFLSVKKLCGKLFPLFYIYFLPIIGFSQTSATSSAPATITTSATASGTDWTNPSNVQSADGSYTTCLITGSNKPTYNLDAKNWGFVTGAGANQIPAGATINGIEVEVKMRKTNVGSIRDLTIQMLKAGIATGSNKARGATLWPTTAAYVKFGSSVDLWGATWVGTDLINAGFGVRVTAKNRGNKDAQAEIDHIKITIYFNQTLFYSKSTGNLSALATWGIVTDGTGSAPANFTNNGQVFILKNRTTAIVDANMTIGGTNSKMVIGDGIAATTLTIPLSFSLTSLVDITALSGMIIQNTFIPTLNILADNTTVEYAATTSQNVQEANYYNLILSGSGTKSLQNGATGSSVVNNILTINTGVTFDNQGKNVFVYGTAGGIVNNGTAAGPARFTYSLDATSTNISGSGTFSNLEMDFTSSGTLTLSGATSINGTLYLTNGTFANGTNLTMTSGSGISLTDGALNSPISSSSGYDVIHNPFTGTTKNTSHEISGTLRNLTIQVNNGTQKMVLDRALILTGNLLIGSGEFDPSASNFGITLGGNFTNNGVYTARTNTITFNGTVTQTVSGTSAPTFYNLTINNGSGGRTQLNAPVLVNNLLTLTNGIVTSSATNLMITGASASISGGSNSSFINGPLAQTVAVTSLTNKFFLIGKGSIYRAVTLTVTQASAAATVYTGEMFSGPPATRTLPPSLTTVSDVRYFNLVKGVGATVNAASVLINYGPDDAVSDAPNLRIAKSNGTGWDDLGGTGTAVTTGSITSTNSFTTFSDFALANATGGLNILPVRWRRLSAQAVGNKVEVRWETVNELNCDYFEMERSAEGLTWSSVDRVAAKSSSGTNKYLLVDNLPLTAIEYYRIRQVDLNGKYFYSKVMSVKNTRDEKSAILVKQNPVINAVIRAEINDRYFLDSRNILVGITDMSGKLLYKRQQAGRNIEIKAAFLKKGIYVLFVKGGTITKETKVVIE